MAATLRKSKHSASILLYYQASYNRFVLLNLVCLFNLSFNKNS